MNQVQYYRLQLDLTQADLAAAIGICPGTLSHLENETRGASSKMMVRIANALGRTVTEVFFPGDTEASTQPTALVPVKSEPFNGITCDFYNTDQEEEIYMTRQQIGQALGYSEPQKSIDKIHERHKNRLDKFSTTVTLGVVEGGRNVTREMVVYSAKGVYEICRWSRQSKADDFMDFVWEVVEAIRKTGSYSVSTVPANGYSKARLQRIEAKVDALYALCEKPASYEPVENTDEWLAALPDILTIEDIRHYLGVSYSRAEMLVKRPGFPTRLVSGKYLTIKTAFIEWLEETTRYGIYARRQICTTKRELL